MTMSETAADTTGGAGVVPPTSLEAAVTTTDHLVVGRAWIASGALFLVVSLLAGLLANLERLDLAGVGLFGSADEFFQFWSAHRVGFVLLAVVPVIVGLATAVVPLQVGATSIVFPRAAALGFWTWLLGAVLTVTGFLIDGGLGTPGSGSQRQAVALTLVGLLMVIGGICVASLCIVTTVAAGRPSGMSLDRVPLFSWTLLVAGTIWLATLPVLAANAVLAYVDLRGRPAVGFGAEDAIWEQLSWAFTHPQVYVFALPLLGIAADVIPVAARRRLPSHNALLVVTGLIGVVGFGAYAQPAFDLSTPVMTQALYVVEAFLAVPLVLLVVGALADTLRRGSGNLGARPPAPVVLAVLSLLLLVAGTVVGAIRAVSPLDLLDRSTTGAQMTFTMGAALVAAMAGTLWWGDRTMGRVAPQGMGLVGGLLATLGVVLVAVPDTLSGFMGLSDFTGADLAAAGDPGGAVGALNAVAVVGSLLLLLGAVGWIATGVRRMKGAEASPDPWGGHTLEWATGPVEVTSERPLLDAMAEVGA